MFLAAKCAAFRFHAADSTRGTSGSCRGDNQGKIRILASHNIHHIHPSRLDVHATATAATATAIASAASPRPAAPVLLVVTAAAAADVVVAAVVRLHVIVLPAESPGRFTHPVEGSPAHGSDVLFTPMSFSTVHDSNAERHGGVALTAVKACRRSANFTLLKNSALSVRLVGFAGTVHEAASVDRLEMQLRKWQGPCETTGQRSVEKSEKEEAKLTNEPMQNNVGMVVMLIAGQASERSGINSLSVAVDESFEPVFPNADDTGVANPQ
ncbi:hypothetical protein HDU84_003961 [Entophlyctis sp. JEL0112]|nr:hypothetical protein HDU84_003961 [Entophlyctis sp. JEL0112]